MRGFLAKLSYLTGIIAIASACSTVPANAGLLDGLLPSGVGEAQNRCLTYGFKDSQKLARCTELEMSFDKPKSWKFGEINAAQNRCLTFGFRYDELAACVQRQLRHLQ
jgi:hypothetical protein